MFGIFRSRLDSLFQVWKVMPQLTCQTTDRHSFHVEPKIPGPLTSSCPSETVAGSATIQHQVHWQSCEWTLGVIQVLASYTWLLPLMYLCLRIYDRLIITWMTSYVLPMIYWSVTLINFWSQKTVWMSSKKNIKPKWNIQLNMLSNEIFIEYVQVGIFRSIDSPHTATLRFWYTTSTKLWGSSRCWPHTHGCCLWCISAFGSMID